MCTSRSHDTNCAKYGAQLIPIGNVRHRNTFLGSVMGSLISMPSFLGSSVAGGASGADPRRLRAWLDRGLIDGGARMGPWLDSQEVEALDTPLIIDSRSVSRQWWILRLEYGEVWLRENGPIALRLGYFL